VNALRILGGSLLALLTLIVAAKAPSPPHLAPFLAVLILPILAALAWTRRAAIVPFLAGAIYSLAAGAQRLYYPDGDVTFVNQISTAALCALSIAVIARLVVWIAAPLRRGKNE
jgi:hypothetical protein